MKRYLLAGSALALGSVSHATMAQQGDEREDAVPADQREDEAGGGLNVITVTAQRREETLQDVAIAINAATGAELIQSGVVDASQLNKVAPALYVTTGGGPGVGYFVRGVGNYVNNGFTNPAVAFNIDGVYMGRSSSTVASFLDLSRVEVLKGPQGTLYGRNATGGAINVIPNVPRFGRLEGSVTGQYGNYDAYQLTGVVNVPLGDDVAVRLAATTSERDGYFSDGTGSAKDMALRGQIRAALGDAVDVRLSVDYSTQKGTGPGLNVDGVYRFTPFSPAATIPNYTHIPAPANVAAPFTGLHAPQTLNFILNNASAGPLFSPVTGYAYPFRDDKFFGVNAEINVDLGGIDLVVIPAYRRSELDTQFNGPPFKAAINQDVAKQYSVEARLSGDVGPVDWIVGGYWYDENVKGLNSFNQFATTTFNDFDYDSGSLAAFARLTFHVSDDLRLVGGIRYTDESRSMEALSIATTAVCLIPAPPGAPQSCPQVPTIPVGLTLQDSLLALPPGIFPAASPLTGPSPYGAFPYGPFGMTGPQALWINTPTVIDREAGDEEITWRAAIEYDATPDNLLYVSFETGFRAGGFNTTFGQEEYEPEFIDAWTIGSKNSFFNNRLQVNLEGFYWKYSGQQLAALGVDRNGNNSFFTRNVGKSTVKGVEVDFQALATRSTRLFGGVQYLKATYDSFQYSQVDTSPATAPANFLTPVTGCSYTQILTPRRSFDVDCSGKPALYSPEWTINLGVEQVVPVDFGEFTASVQGRYRSDRVIGFQQLPTGNTGDDTTIDASLSFQPDNLGLTITAFVHNLTNEAIRSTYQIGAGNVSSSAYEPPRTYGLRVGYEF
jgi:iron complex outermembrane recepter protein